jgi:hypothetical protein
VERTPQFMQLAALQGPHSGPGMRASAPGDERRMQVPLGAPFNGGSIAHGTRKVPEHAAMPVLPAQALGENRGWGKGGRCGGPCAEPAKPGGKAP